MQENIAYKEYVEAIGSASDGNTVDGSTSTGLVAYDEVYARGGVFEANIGTNLPTDPTGLAPGDLYVNGGVLMVVMPFDTP